MAVFLGKAVVLYVAEKEPVLNLGLNQLSVPIDIGSIEGITHDCARHSTATLFVVLNIAKGLVLTACKHHYRHEEHLDSLK